MFGTDQRAWAVRQVEDNLRQIRDNWDGHYAKPPNEEAIQGAATLLNALPPNMPIPDVSPSTEGGVILEWESPDTEILLIIESANQIEVSVYLEESLYEGPLEDVAEEFFSALVRIPTLS